MATTVHELPLEALVELVNGWGGVPRSGGDRDGDPYPTLASLDTGDALPAGARAALTHEGLAGAADRLQPVFATDDPAERALLVNSLLAETAVGPVLLPGDEGPSGAWRVPNRADALLASAAVALRAHLAAHADRIGSCADPHCDDVYVDASPGGHRRFCSLTCQNRSRVAAYRRRRRAES